MEDSNNNNISDKDGKSFIEKYKNLNEEEKIKKQIEMKKAEDIVKKIQLKKQEEELKRQEELEREEEDLEREEELKRQEEELKIEEESKIYNYSCYRDGKKFETEKEYIKHFAIVHPNDYPFYCYVCNHGFYSNDAIESHYKKNNHYS